MTDTQWFLGTVWLSIWALIWFGAIGALTEDSPGTDRRGAARAVLWAPFWPVVLALILLRTVPRFIGRVFYDALGPEKEEECRG